MNQKRKQLSEFMDVNVDAIKRLKLNKETENNNDNNLDHKHKKSSHLLLGKRQGETQWTMIDIVLNYIIKKWIYSTKKTRLLINLLLLKDNKHLDMIYGFNIDNNGKWRCENERLIFNPDNTKNIGSEMEWNGK